MTAPAEIPFWGTEQGGDVLAGLVPTSATFYGTEVVSGVTYGLIDYAFSDSPDLSDVLTYHRLTVSGFTLNANNGTNLVIVAKDETNFKLRVRSTSRTTDSLDESGVTGSATVTTGGSQKQEPALQKQAQGHNPGEKPSAQVENWWKNLVGEWIEHFAGGGAIVLRATIAAWQAITRTTAGSEMIQGSGWSRFDPDATDAPGEGVLQQDSGAGRGFIESAHPDAVLAMLSAFQAEVLPAVTASLNFGSTAQHVVNTLTVTVPGALPGDGVTLGAPSTIEAGFLWSGYVSAANTVTIRLAKIASGTVDPAEATWSVRVTRPNSMPVITVRGLKIFVNLIGEVYDSTSLEADLSIPENEAAFNLLVNSRQHRAAILDGGTIEAIVSGSATADAIITATGGY